MSGRSWTVSRTAMTLLFGDLGHGVPLPFEPHHPYTTTAERDAYREPADSALLQALSVLASGPTTIVAMGALGDGILLARASRDGRNTVLAQHTDPDTVTITEVPDLVAAVVRLIPDATPARGTSVRVSLSDQPASDSIFNDVGPSTGRRTVTTLFGNGVSRCGAFLPVHKGTQQPPITWYDTATDTARWFATTTTDPHGTPWTTYVPGDNTRIGQALHTIVDAGVAG